MNTTISALAIAVIAAISGSPAHGAVILIDFQQALNSDEIKKALGDDAAFYLSGATTSQTARRLSSISSATIGTRKWRTVRLSNATPAMPSWATLH